MVMMAILGFFLTVIWLVIPFVVFAVKGKVDRTLLLLESVERRLAILEERLSAAAASRPAGESEARPDVPSTGGTPPPSGE